MMLYWYNLIHTWTFLLYKSGTMKLKKRDLQKESYEFTKIKDAEIMVVDHKAKTYVPMNADLYDKINKGQTRF